MAKKTEKSEKPADEKLPAEPQTEFKGKVNAYGFFHLNKKLREAWNIKKGTIYPINVELIKGNLLLKRI